MASWVSSICAFCTWARKQLFFYLTDSVVSICSQWRKTEMKIRVLNRNTNSRKNSFFQLTTWWTGTTSLWRFPRSEEELWLMMWDLLFQIFNQLKCAHRLFAVISPLYKVVMFHSGKFIAWAVINWFLIFDLWSLVRSWPRLEACCSVGCATRTDRTMAATMTTTSIGIWSITSCRLWVRIKNSFVNSRICGNWHCARKESI